MADIAVRVMGALYGQAIGDAMGAPVEGWPPERIAARFGEADYRRFLPPTHGGDPGVGKGGGRVTDDTLMVEALMRAYIRAGDHMDAYGYEAYMIPEIAETIVWLPERGRDMPILDRLFWPEKYPWIRLTVGHADPRSAGVGNTVNCGVAMYVMPVGAVNAGDPAGAYQEAAAFALAHNESYAVEAGAVMAACFAAALGVGATVDSVLTAAEGLARDGTGKAIAAVLEATDSAAPVDAFIRAVRSRVAPYDPRTGHASDDAPLKAAGVSDVGRPSRLRSIEELPVALAALKYGGGDFHRVLQAGVRYGRDNDSIAGMACGLWGALHGADAIPERWRRDVDQANRRDWGAQARAFSDVVRSILARDQVRWAARRAAIGVARALS